MKSHQISAHLLVCLVCQETMAVKNFVFRENWIDSKVAGMKQPFLPFLTQPGPTFWEVMLTYHKLLSKPRLHAFSC